MSTRNPIFFKKWENLAKADYTSSHKDGYGSFRPKSKTILKIIPRWAVFEFAALVVGLLVSIQVLFLSLSIDPEISSVFLIPIFAALTGIAFMIVKRSE